MENISDAKLQELLAYSSTERNIDLSLQEIHDLKIYEHLVDILNNEPSPKVPQAFSTKVIQLIQQKKYKKHTIILYALFGIIIFSSLPLFLFLLNTEVFNQIFEIIKQHLGIVLFSISMVILIHFTDRKKGLKFDF